MNSLETEHGRGHTCTLTLYIFTWPILRARLEGLRNKTKVKQAETETKRKIKTTDRETHDTAYDIDD